MARPEEIRLVHITTVWQTLRFFSGQIGFMRAQGIAVTAIASPHERLQWFGETQGIKVHGVPMLRSIAPLHDLRALIALVRVLQEIRPTIVHSHTPKGGLLGMIAAWLCRIPVRVYHLHGLPLVTAHGMKRRLLWMSDWLACRLAHQVLCVSASLRDLVIAEGLCPQAMVKTLHHGSINGVDAKGLYNPHGYGSEERRKTRAQYDIPPDALVVGYVGRIVRDKGVAELVTAWQSLRNLFPAAHMLVVGQAEPQDPVPAAAMQAMSCDPRIHRTGHVIEGLPELYLAMDVVALPSYREGMAVVPLEAAAMQLPVVATRIPGCVDTVVDGQTGTLVAPGDADALAEALHQYLADPELRQRHGAAGRNRVLDRFRQEDIWEATYAEYQRLLAQLGITAAQTPSAR